ncbi:hypothetical protein CTM97_15585 [Photobacterium phosphoreum]|uniref:Uncharacterized protein n=1 Tax=Photobacterium phosphoreum TaxID=659 RepID=A0A2T3JSZ3_PHOPO|nr:hypothetical protein [Photobacterium phosphoreum]PSU22061.1 hypothetical protein CTM96_17090 [Photobacterium phosphoreum]PSU40427.1 hypothetical protein CTM97_15585 [Photobacterium phosphoreum]PSU52294.1 hypothetical protein C9J18_09115 [Photobacterium phosphoreum]
MSDNAAQLLISTTPLKCFLTLDYGYKLPDTILKNMALELKSLGLYIKKEQVLKKSFLIVEIDNLANIFELNTNYFINVWDAALIDYFASEDSIYTTCIKKGACDLRDMIVQFVNDFVMLNQKLNYIVKNKLRLTDSKLGDIYDYYAIVNINGELKISNPIAILSRGTSVNDALSKEELSLYSYKRNIRETSLDLPRRTKSLLLGIKPKRKTSAKVELFLCSIDSLIYITPKNTDIRLTIVDY